MRVVKTQEYEEPRDALSHDWIDWLGGLGHVPLPIPNRLSEPGDYLMALGIDALILTGGNDIVARPGKADRIAPDRDRTENALLDAALAANLPVLGVCRGLHVINRYFGGGIDSDISGGTVGHVGITHQVALKDAFAALSEAATLETNSFHNQAVTIDDLAPDLRIAAVSEEDRVVEALVHNEHPVAAVQWHPERDNPAEDFDRTLLARLLADGVFWRNGR